MSLITKTLVYGIDRNSIFPPTFDQYIALPSRPLFPNIFICEDSKKDTIELWDKLFDKFEFTQKIYIVSSCGCSKDDQEISIKRDQEYDKSYRPKIFRQLDRDGLTDQQISAITANKQSKYSGLGEKYKVSFLPVADIENFAVLISGTTKNTKGVKIRDQFMKRAENKCIEFSSVFRGANERTLFSLDGYQMYPIMIKMREEAKTDPTRFFPGKMLIDTNKAINILSGLRKDDLPSDLINYLQEIKDFFQV